MIDASVVASAERARERLSHVRADGGTWFAESYIDGREINVSLLANGAGVEVLPIAEIRFIDYPADKPRIVGYKAKWNEDSFEYRHTLRDFAIAKAEQALHTRLAALARTCWQLFDMRGYARVDLRVDPQGEPWVLEINANPCLSSDAGFAAAWPRPAFRSSARSRASSRQRRASHARLCAACEPRRPPVVRKSRSARPVGKRMEDGIEYRWTLRRDDPERIRRLVAATGFFSPEEQQIAIELAERALRQGHRQRLRIHHRGAGCEPRRLRLLHGPIAGTKSSYDLYWIAVHPELQGRGLGRSAHGARRDRDRERRAARACTWTPPHASSTRRRGRSMSAWATARHALLEDFYAPGDGKGDPT